MQFTLAWRDSCSSPPAQVVYNRTFFQRCPVKVIGDRVEPAASPAMSAMPQQVEVNSEK